MPLKSQGRTAAVLFHIALPAVVGGWMHVLRPARPLFATASGLPTPSDVRRGGALGVAALASICMVAAVPASLILLLCVALTLAIEGYRVAPSATVMRRWGIVLSIIPALVLIAPYMVGAAAAGAWPALLVPGDALVAVEAPASWMLILGVPAPMTSLTWWQWAALTAWALVLLACVTAAVVAWRRRVSEFRMAAAAGAAFVGALSFALAWALTQLPVAADGMRVVTAWPGAALSLASLAFLIIPLVLIQTPCVWDSTRLRAVVRTSYLWIGAATIAAITMTVGTFVTPISAWGMGITATGASRVTATSVVPAVTATAQNSSSQGRALRLSTDTNGTLQVTLLRYAGTALTDTSPAASYTAYRSRLSTITDTSSIGDTASAELARTAVSALVYPDSTTAMTLAAHGIDTIIVDSAFQWSGSIGLDQAAGLEYIGVTDAGSVWRVRPDGNHAAWATVQAADGTWQTLTSSLLRTTTTVDTASGTLVLAERADSGWVATLGGTELVSTTAPATDGTGSGQWRQAWTLTGNGTVTISYRTWWGTAWMVLTLVMMAAALLASVPLRTQRRYDSRDKVADPVTMPADASATIEPAEDTTEATDE